MTGTIDLDENGKSLLIRFPYRADLVEEVRLIPGRRWDSSAKVWKVPVLQAGLVIETFTAHGFSLAPEVDGLREPPLEGAGPLFENPAAPTELEPPPALTISILNERVRQCLRKAFLDPVWVVGEVHDFDKSKGRTHVFFSLVEKRAGENKPAARVEVALFASTLERLAPKLQGENGVALADGVEIRALVRVDLYPSSGRYQLILEDIDPEFTLGKLALTREKILADLRQRGLHRRNAQLELPCPALRIGVLASPESDGWNDLFRQLESSGIGFAVTCYAVRVQGEALRPTLLAGLRYFAEHRDDHDVVCIVRGGGSKTDLSWFDDPEVALAVATHPLKIVCGIGHHRDQSVLDLISHSERTPTAVGAMLIDNMRVAQAQLLERAHRISRRTRDLLGESRQRVRRTGERLRLAVHGHVTTRRHGLAEDARRLQRAAGQLCARQTESVLLRHRDLGSHLRRLLRRTEEQLTTREERRRLLDPKRVLERGFALVRSAGKLVSKVEQVQPGMALDIEFQDGHARADGRASTEGESPA